MLAISCVIQKGVAFFSSGRNGYPELGILVGAKTGFGGFIGPNLDCGLSSRLKVRRERGGLLEGRGPHHQRAVRVVKCAREPMLGARRGSLDAVRDENNLSMCLGFKH